MLRVLIGCTDAGRAEADLAPTLLWRGNVDADELNGYVEYRQSSGAGAGRVHARLAYLRPPGNVDLDRDPASFNAFALEENPPFVTCNRVPRR